MKKLTLFSALILTGLLGACGGSDPSNKPDTLFPDGYEPLPPPVGGSDDNIVNTPLPILEDFDNAIDIGGFFSADYKPLSTDNPEDAAPSFYYPTCCLYDDEGNVQENSFWLSDTENKKMRFGNARFTIGQTLSELAGDASDPKINTTSATNTDSWGELDLSRPYKVSFCVVQTGGSENMLIFVDNNTTGEANSKWGGGTNGSPIFKQNVNSLIPGQRVTINVPGETRFSPDGPSVLNITEQVGEEHSFLQVRVGSGGYAIIDDLVIEYQDETSIEPAAETCVADPDLQAPPPKTAPATPATPVLLAGDGQITASWSAVSGASEYEVVYNTVDSAEGATPFNGNPVTGTSALLTELINDTTYYVFVRAINVIGVSDYSAGASATPEVAPPSTGTALPFTVNLNVSKNEFFGTDATPAQTLTNYPSLPMYFIEGGGSGITLEGGNIKLANGGRFTIGQVSVPAPSDTSSADTSVAGDLDLSQPYKIVINVVSASDTGNFQVYVDNNTASSGNSMHGSDSRVFSIGAVDITDGQVIEIIMDGVDRIGTANSFVQLRTDSGIGEAGIVISGVSIEPLNPPAEFWTAESLALVGTANTTPSGEVSVNTETEVTLTATGGNLSSDAHQIFFAHREIAESDFVFTARIASISGADIGVGNSYRFGLMVMSDLDVAESYTSLAGWADAGFYVDGDTPTLTASRANTKANGDRTRTNLTYSDGTTTTVATVGDYFRIEVYDDGEQKRVRRLFSKNGIEYLQANSTVDFKATSATDNWFVGLYAAPGENEVTITFDNISIEPLAP